MLGSPPNAIVAGYAADELGREIGFLEWMMLGLPLAFVFILIGWVLMTRVLYRFKLDGIPGGRQMIDDEIEKLGPLAQGERIKGAKLAEPSRLECYWRAAIVPAAPTIVPAAQRFSQRRAGAEVSR